MAIQLPKSWQREFLTLVLERNLRVEGSGESSKHGKKEALSLSERASSEKDVRFFLLGNTDRAQVAHVFHVFYLGLTTLLVDSVPFLEEFLP